MPALPPAPFCLKLRTLGTVNTSPWVSVMHAQYAGTAPTAADCVSIATALRTAWNTNLIPQLNALTVINTFEVTDLSSPTSAQGSLTNAATGTVSPSVQPVNSSCVVISWNVQFHYRGGHPRTYLPLKDAFGLTAGKTLPTTYVSSLGSAAAAFLTAVNAITFGTSSLALAMVSYHQHNSARPQGVPFLITGAKVHSRLDSQRRRLGKETG